MPRHQLTDAEWDLLRDLLPPERPARPGRPWKPHRRVLDAIFWIVAAGAAWRDLPDDYQPWQTVYDRFARWQKDGTWDRLVEALQGALLADGRIDLDLWCVDGTSIRAHKAAAGAPKKTTTPRSRPTTPWAARRAAGGPRRTC